MRSINFQKEAVRSNAGHYALRRISVSQHHIVVWSNLATKQYGA